MAESTDNKQYYCCNSNLTAAKVIAIICISLRALELYYFNDKPINKILGLHLNDYILVHNLTYISIDILLLIGCLSRTRILLMVWMVSTVFELVAAFIVMFVNFGIGISSLLWNAWTCGLVYGAFSDMTKIKS